MIQLPFYIGGDSINAQEKEVAQYLLDNEKELIKLLEKQYQSALNDVNKEIQLLMSNELTQSKIYQLEYQKALKGQIEAILEQLHGKEYETIQQYLQDCYTNAFIGTAYNLAGQGIPLIMPIDQAAIVKAIMTDSKLSEGLYESLGVDMNALKKSIREEISRGLSTGMGFKDIARNISNVTGTPFSHARTIVNTEGHRIQQTSNYDAQKAAKAKGAKVVKQWDSTLDGKTRTTHRRLDGQIREVDEPFEMDGKEAMFPGDFGDPAEDCNCRCVSLTRAKWALDEDELQTLKSRAEYWGLDKTESFEEFKKNYLKAAGDSSTKSNKGLENSKNSDTIKMKNTEVRKWYVDNVAKIPESIDKSLPIEEQARLAFEARNRLRTEARNIMADEETRKMLDATRPNKTFEELIESKMKRKGMTREEAIRDIYETATKTNADINKELGIDGE